MMQPLMWNPGSGGDLQCHPLVINGPLQLIEKSTKRSKAFIRIDGL